MSKPAIKVEGIGKSYRIGLREKANATFREALIGMARAPIERLKRLGEHNDDGEDVFWALRGVGFEVQPGEVVGIIGRNGAGKSTLLKILSRITEPTEGRVTIRGRVGSLLEVGTGFHPELTGRENVYLNGAILGMKRTEIDRKFDAIVDFSRVGKFLDTPVKRYSSGMRVRLGFAVAAHLEPEVLIVDEVLAVGDAEFQAKCLGKMKNVACSGRTVLFVSHNLVAMQSLCTQGVFLRKGAVEALGGIDAIIAEYLKSLRDSLHDLSQINERHGKGESRIERVVLRSGGREVTRLAAGSSLRIEFQVSRVISAVHCVFTLYDQVGQAVVNFDSRNVGAQDRRDVTQGNVMVCEMDQLLLLPGEYRMNVAVYGDGVLQDHLEGAAFIGVAAAPIAGRMTPGYGSFGRVVIPHRWSIGA